MSDRLVICVCCGMYFYEDDDMEFSTQPVCDYCSGEEVDWTDITLNSQQEDEG